MESLLSTYSRLRVHLSTPDAYLLTHEGIERDRGLLCFLLQVADRAALMGAGS